MQTRYVVFGFDFAGDGYLLEYDCDHAEATRYGESWVNDYGKPCAQWGQRAATYEICEYPSERYFYLSNLETDDTDDTDDGRMTPPI